MTTRKTTWRSRPAEIWTGDAVAGRRGAATRCAQRTPVTLPPIGGRAQVFENGRLVAAEDKGGQQP